MGDKNGKVRSQIKQRAYTEVILFILPEVINKTVNTFVGLYINWHQ